jgi:hypothetical protein
MEAERLNPTFATMRDAEAAVRQGYSAEEKAAFQGQLARSQNQGYRLATQSNPNLAGAVTAGMNYANIGAMADFASRDAAMRRQKQEAFLRRSDLETQRQLSEKQMRLQQFGRAYSDAQTDISNALGAGLTGLTNVFTAYQGKAGGKSLLKGSS